MVIEVSDRFVISFSCDFFCYVSGECVFSASCDLVFSVSWDLINRVSRDLFYFFGLLCILRFL